MNIEEKANQILESKVGRKEKVIKLCDLVREIPYKRIGSFDPKDMIREGRGSCTPKHVFLATYFEKLGVPFKFLVIPFYYKKLNLRYPQYKRETVENMPISYHVALQAKIDDKWRIVDVTWDNQLKELGFQVNDVWDGNTDMKLGVIPEEIIEIKVDPREFEKGKLKNFTAREKLARKEFYKLLEEMTNQIRNTS